MTELVDKIKQKFPDEAKADLLVDKVRSCVCVCTRRVSVGIAHTHLNTHHRYLLTRYGGRAPQEQNGLFRNHVSDPKSP